MTLGVRTTRRHCTRGIRCAWRLSLLLAAAAVVSRVCWAQMGCVHGSHLLLFLFVFFCDLVLLLLWLWFVEIITGHVHGVVINCQ